MTFDVARTKPKKEVKVTAEVVDQKVDDKVLELNLSLAEIYEKQENDKLENQLALAELYESLIS